MRVRPWAAVLLLPLFGGVAAAAVVERESVSSTAAQGNFDSDTPVLTPDGRFVAFASVATNLVAGDTNDFSDVFLRDRQTGTTTRVSVSSSGVQGNEESDLAALSADGRFVAFTSCASNLVASDSNGFCDVFVRDRQLSTTARVSISSTGTQGDDDSDGAAISGDGRYVAFTSYATGLVTNDNNLLPDIFVRDRQTSTTTRVSISSAGVESDGANSSAVISSDGRFVAFVGCGASLVAGDTNAACDIFVRDRQVSATERISVASSGAQGNNSSFAPAMSSDGRYVVFWSYATNLVVGDTNGFPDVFLRDRQMGTTERISIASGGSQGNGFSSTAAVSADGRYVAFVSCANNLVANDTNGVCDLFVRDRQAVTTRRLSVGGAGVQANGSSNAPAISSSLLVAFDSSATNLIGNDTNAAYDVFLVRPSCGDEVTDLGEQCDDGNTANGDCCGPTCQLESAITLCRPAGGPCDVAEFCTGTSASCPSDAKSTGVCRPAVGDCDVAERCDGVSNVCPADQLAPAGAGCTDDGDICTSDQCDGGGHCLHILQCTTTTSSSTTSTTTPVPTTTSSTSSTSTSATLPSTTTASSTTSTSTSTTAPSSTTTAPSSTTSSSSTTSTTTSSSSSTSTSTSALSTTSTTSTTIASTTTTSSSSTSTATVPSTSSSSTTSSTSATTTTAVSTTTTTTAGAASALNHFQCYRIRGEQRLEARTVTLVDDLETKRTIVARPESLCVPVDVSGQGIDDPSAHLACYRIKDERGQPKFAPVGFFLQNELGIVPLRALGPRLLCLPAGKDDRPADLGADRFKCYRAKAATRFVPVGIGLADEFGTTDATVLRPQTACRPVDVDGSGVRDPTTQLACYKVRRATAGFTPQTAVVRDSFGEQSVLLVKPQGVCVPSTAAE